eukprot:GHVU01058786.1.p1 GENE.GHVU01058786.1~~GHVU01058786.1.p1  ORF type:complete len:208 (-),score=15.08 GHVU01058786.1:87-710(-)
MPTVERLLVRSSEQEGLWKTIKELEDVGRLDGMYDVLDWISVNTVFDSVVTARQVLTNYGHEYESPMGLHKSTFSGRRKRLRCNVPMDPRCPMSMFIDMREDSTATISWNSKQHDHGLCRPSRMNSVEVETVLAEDDRGGRLGYSTLERFDRINNRLYDEYNSGTEPRNISSMRLRRRQTMLDEAVKYTGGGAPVDTGGCTGVTGDF